MTMSLAAGKSLASFIDHSLLNPMAGDDQIARLCEEAVKYKFAAVCIGSGYVFPVSKALNGTGVKVCAVVGFPLGIQSDSVKAFEAEQAVSSGADEIDFVINLGAVKSGRFEDVRREILAVRRVTDGKILKVILETCYLERAEKVRLCDVARESGADFVKTSTGFGIGGATVDDVSLLRATVGPAMGVKASGGIRDRKTALAMIEAGATRLGTSSSVKIVSE
jgi:deoxyribose-phosphate aldolase